MRIEHHSLRWLAWKLHVKPEDLVTLDAALADHYQPFEKVVKGKLRPLLKPSKTLRLILRRMRRRLLAPLPVEDFVHGCIARRSPYTNALVHVGQRNVASIDVKDFYPSIDPFMVYRVWRERVGLGPRLAGFCTRITTLRFSLPQGSPTSDALANQAMCALDQELKAIAASLNLRLTRYLDNVDFSGVNARDAIGPAVAAINAQGLAVRHKKVFNAGPSASHVVTGYTVNGKTAPSAPRSQRDKARAAVHRLICAAQRGEDTQKLEASVRGHLSHLRLSNKGAVKRLQRQLDAAGISLSPVSSTATRSRRPRQFSD
jgi:hypothetical protein